MRTRIWLSLALMACLPAGRALAGPSTAAAESLLSAPDDAGWSLEAMMAARTKAEPAPEQAAAAQTAPASRGPDGPAEHAEHPERDAVATLRRRVRTLLAQVAKEKAEEAALRDSLAQAQAGLAAKPAPVTPAAAPDTGALKAAVADRERQNDVLTNQVSTLKAALAVRERRLRDLLAPQDALRRTLAQKESDLTALQQELAGLRGSLAQKTADLAVLTARLKAAPAATPDAGLQAALKKAQAEAAAAQDALAARNAAFASLQKQEAGQAAALKTLQATKDRTVSDLNAALAARGDELKQAAAALADLREQQKARDASAAPATAAQRRAYMAGVTMAEGLGSRLEGWKQAGVETDMAMFRAGLADGLQGQVRLKPDAARRAQADFMQAVQAGAARKVADAQKQLAALAKGRRPLKSAGGVSWYRVRRGKAVTPGAPVSLSMTEQVAGGAVVSRVPALILRPGDDVPSIVKDGMYLPGEGGEVVAYGLARQVYGDLPLPAGVQPFTVMEYHLKGESLPPQGVTPPRRQPAG